MKTLRAMGAVATVLVAIGCGDDDAGRDDGGGGSGGSDVTLPNVNGVTFVSAVTNPYFPLPVGAKWKYEAVTDEGIERSEVEVLAETKTIQGVVATVVKDTEYLDDEIIEDTHDWFAQDEAGNVWYLGEDTCEFVDGACDGEYAGSWQWGVDGALPGIVMPAAPKVDGKRYYQEYYPGEAEDVGEVIEVGVSVTVPAGSYDDCIRTHDTSTLDLNADETKTFCAGVGNVHTQEDDVEVELIDVTGISGPSL